ncbi:MAG: 2-oxo acid dehydrogenase subunit E2 [Euryarchaeota archaeon]|nr:2-oxo acid dehydrogenase subunit E2 [Euryarchaeota archaeon]MDE1836229.1 2-oxo acid dehydrogenase subunit E2 [Euryarchaeota archaeon]MDE1880882.1 2-oxo acid dehydrogenase subunit E2 [Euryarchaeota archaeon]MDE2045010.1 2-oxo acid dehydrogenase subunit E2 [Thermoplasmata archaeon]
MVFEFRLPDIGEGVAEGEVVAWHVKAGDSVKEDQPLVSVLTDKANVEIPSPRTGRVLSLHAKEGEVVKVGGLLVSIEEAGGGGSAPPVAAPSHGHGAGGAVAASPSAASSPSPPISPSTAPAQGVSSAGGRVLASPAVRHRAAQLRIDLSQVRGTGPQGRVTDTDLDAFAKGGSVGASASASAVAVPATSPSSHAPPSRVDVPIPSAPAPAPVAIPAAPGPLQTRVQIRGLRRVIAEHMAISHARAANFTYVEEVDVSELVRVREKSKKRLEEKGVQLSYLPFIVKAVVQGLKAHPSMNAYVDDAKQEIVLCKYYNMGIAAAAPDGLIVPVVRDADRKSITALAREIQDLSERGKAGKLLREELSGSTFSITSLGALGGVLATPILNYPEVAILGVHKISKRPVYAADGSIVPAHLMNLSVTLDHRVLDGITGAEFLAVVKSHLEDPHQLFLEMA